jgi:O-succinylbenzoic acid--CoA ligase
MSAEPRSTTWLDDVARRAPERVAAWDAAGSSLSYGELLERALSLAPGLAGGAGPVAFELEPGLDHVVAVHAAMQARRPLMTIRPGLPENERDAVLRAGAPGRVLGPEAIASLSAGPAAEPGVPRPDTTLARVLSSGTAGARRPVDLTFANFAASASASGANLGVLAEDVWLACLPMDHVGGLSILTRSAIYGTAVLVHPRFDVGAIADALDSQEPRVTLISLVPTQLRRLLDAGVDLSRLRVILVGGAALAPDLLERCLVENLPVVQSYGLTQACSQVCTLAPGEAAGRAGSSGRPLAGIEVRIRSSGGVEAGGAAGEIEVRGAVVAPAAAGPDGWLRTGDVGRLDSDGYLWVAGRADDTIVSGGENVRPEPVEERLEQHPAVAEAAVIGRPDREWGEALVAVVVPAPGVEPTGAELIAHCRQALAPAMVPKSVEVVAELPRTSSGKLQRARLRG